MLNGVVTITWMEDWVFKTVDEFNKELNIISIQMLEKTMMVRDLRKEIESQNQQLDKLLSKATKVRQGFKEFLDNNPDERRKFFGAKRDAEIQSQQNAQTEQPSTTQDSVDAVDEVPSV
jgi:septal ring factor EnvC (AmiA/AmiB activator)